MVIRYKNPASSVEADVAKLKSHTRVPIGKFGLSPVIIRLINGKNSPLTGVMLPKSYPRTMLDKHYRHDILGKSS
jgi:hypothetical protein